VVSKTAQLATRAVRYLEAGTGRPLVLLHAFPLNAEQWLPQLARVPPGWRYIAPDMRGLGRSESGLVRGEASMDLYAQDVFEVMAHLDVRTAAVAGLSMGGYVALAMVRRAPERVTGLVLADTRAAADTEEGRAGRDRMLAVLERDGPRGVSRAMLPTLLGQTTRRDQPDLAEAIDRIIQTGTSEGVGAAIRAMKHRPDSTPLLPTIACPTVIVCGEEDVITTPEEGEALHRAIPGSRFVLVAGAGHLSNLENPLAFTAALALLR
jgi:3-oxoadipate enol-lactonase